MVKRTHQDDLADPAYAPDDNLAGLATNGVGAHDFLFGASFSSNFEDLVGNYNQVLFATGNCAKFIFTDKDQRFSIRIHSQSHYFYARIPDIKFRKT